MYTIKQAAGILGISKQGLRYWLDRLGIPLEKGKTGQYVITDETVQRIQQAREAKSEVTSEAASKETSKPTSGTAETEELKGETQSEAVSEVTSAEAVALAVLREEITDKKREIEDLKNKLEEKENRIKELTDKLTDALDKAQRLHAGSISMNLLPDAQTEPEPEDGKEAETRTQPGEDPTPRKRTLWERITGKGR